MEGGDFIIGLKNNFFSIQIIPENYLSELIDFIKGKKYGTFSLIIQNGTVVGCDILEKKR